MNYQALSSVLLQTCLSGANLLTFFILAAVGYQNQIAMAIAVVGIAFAAGEAGLSVTAPIILNKNKYRKIYLARSILSISSFVFLIVLGLSSLFMMSLQNHADLIWVASYGLCIWSILLAPSWLGSNFFSVRECFYLALGRLFLLPLLFIWPSDMLFFLGSLVFFLAILYTTTCKIGFPVFLPHSRAIALIFHDVRLIFSSKTLAFLVYNLIPLIINWLFGSIALTNYVLVERIKNLYSSVFSPIIQFVYNSYSPALNFIKQPLISSAAKIGLFNIILGFFFIICNYYQSELISDFFKISKSSFQNGILAAIISVQSSLLLHFSLAAKGLSSGIFLSAFVQTISFFVLVFLAYIRIINTEDILIIAEIAYFLALVIFSMIKYR